MNPADPVPTLKAIALASGFSKSTVSDALRNKANIPPATREKIREVALKMGYVPDARISLAMGHIRARRPLGQRISLGWLNCHKNPEAFSRIPWWKGYWDGASQRAEDLGYHLEPLWLHDPNLPSHRLQKVLLTRGIQGLLLPPPWSDKGASLMEWERFSTAIIGGTALPPNTHRTDVDFFANMQIVLRELAKLGYRRPGLWISGFQDMVSKGRYYGGYYHWQASQPATSRVQTEAFDFDWKQMFHHWLEREQPDVILCLDNGMINLLGEMGYRVPEDIGVVHLNLCSDVPEWSGIDQCLEQIGSAAVDLLTAQLARGEQGLPAYPKRVLIEGRWILGETVRILSEPQGET